LEKALVKCSQGVREKLRIKFKTHNRFPPVSTLYQNSEPFFPPCSHPFSRTLLGISPVDTMHGSRTNDVKTPSKGGRTCDFFVGISGRNLICLIGVGLTGWEITGAKFARSCTLERRKFIGVTSVSSTTRKSIFAAILRNVKYAREKVPITISFKNLLTHFFSWI